MAAEPCSERAEGDMSKADVKKDKKKKKREEEAETRGQMQKLDAAVENLVAEGDGVERKQSSKSKKSKRKRNDAGEASAGDEVVTREGQWTQDEHQQLFDLVNLDLRMKAHQIKDRTNRKLRDNIGWEAISDKLTTRNHKNCCLKWYDTLASPLVREGIWADVDDYLLVEALQKDDAVCVEDVDWDSLLDHRSGEVCRQRWNQMVRGIGGHREKSFIEQVDVLSRRYCPEMIEYRTPKE